MTFTMRFAKTRSGWPRYANRRSSSLTQFSRLKNFDGGRTMYPLKKSISIALGLMVLAGVAVVITTGTVGASPSLAPIAAAPPTPAIPVTVTNTPLPVNIANTPTVNANIGTPNVNINGTPTVNVNSSGATPVYVDTEGARKGFNASCFTGNVDPTYGQASC